MQEDMKRRISEWEKGRTGEAGKFYLYRIPKGRLLGS